MHRWHFPDLKHHRKLGFYGWDGGGSKGRTIHREYNRVQVGCMDIPKMAACERSQMGLRTILRAHEIKNYFGI